jgi:hypothetical protein
MKKEEYIERYGEAAYERRLEQSNEWNRANPDKVEERDHQQSRKGGRRYEKKLKDQTTGIPGERHRIRVRHASKWRQYKMIIAPDSQIHHQWIPETANYEGVALVEADLHMRGIINVIKILKGKITLLTEKEIKEQEVALWTA